jgi:hypothetical protein
MTVSVTVLPLVSVAFARSDTAPPLAQQRQRVDGDDAVMSVYPVGQEGDAGAPLAPLDRDGPVLAHRHPVAGDKGDRPVPRRRR